MTFLRGTAADARAEWELHKLATDPTVLFCDLPDQSRRARATRPEHQVNDRPHRIHAIPLVDQIIVGIGNALAVAHPEHWRTP